MVQQKSLQKSQLLSLKWLLILLLFSLTLTLTLPAIAQTGDTSNHTGEVDFTLNQETLSPSGITSTAYLYASQDSFISSLHPDRNYGGHTTFGMGYWQGLFNAMRPVLQFNIGSLPGDATISKATLYLYQDSSSPINDVNMGYKIQYVKQPWTENSVTWNNASFLGGDDIFVGSLSNKLGWKTFDFTQPVQAWHDGTRANNGIILTGDESPQLNRNRFFRSRQWQGYRPYLFVEYTQCGDQVPPTASVNPLPAWSRDTFNVTWQGSDAGSGILNYDIQYNVNGGSWLQWLSQTKATSDTFTSGVNGQQFQFRARATDNCGNIGNWTGAQTYTNVDTIPPAATVAPLTPYTSSSSFNVSWGGDDNPGGSGIASFDIQLKLNGGAWQDWIKNTSNTTGQIVDAKNGDVYEFQARAKDLAGNQGSYPNAAQASTTVVLYSLAIVDNFPPPAITDQLSFTVAWSGYPAPGAVIDDYDLRYRFNDGAWQTWGNFTSNSELFDQVDDSVDGIYQFEARANDSLGQTEPWNGLPEASMVVDRHEPFIEPVAFFPIIKQD